MSNSSKCLFVGPSTSSSPGQPFVSLITCRALPLMQHPVLKGHLKWLQWQSPCLTSKSLSHPVHQSHSVSHCLPCLLWDESLLLWRNGVWKGEYRISTLASQLYDLGELFNLWASVSTPMEYGILIPSTKRGWLVSFVLWKLSQIRQDLLELNKW